jgi:GTP cyclohydrolase IA
VVDIDGAALAIKDLLGAFGVPETAHTVDTHNRSARSWAEILSGYQEDPADHLDTTFSAERDPGLVIVSGVKLQSMCAHHLLPFSGVATVAYRPSPGQRIVGLSKLARVIVGYARRLQVQENIGFQTVNAIMTKLNPSGTAVLITAYHDCMRLRGVMETHSKTTTLADEGLLQPHERALIQMAHSEHVRDL